MPQVRDDLWYANACCATGDRRLSHVYQCARTPLGRRLTFRKHFQRLQCLQCLELSHRPRHL